MGFGAVVGVRRHAVAGSCATGSTRGGGGGRGRRPPIQMAPNQIPSSTAYKARPTVGVCMEPLNSPVKFAGRTQFGGSRGTVIEDRADDFISGLVSRTRARMIRLVVRLCKEELLVATHKSLTI